MATKIQLKEYNCIFWWHFYCSDIMLQLYGDSYPPEFIQDSRSTWKTETHWHNLLVMHFALIIGAIFMQASERGPGAQGSIGMRWCCPLSIPGFDLVPPTMRKSQYTIRTREKGFLAFFFMKRQISTILVIGQSILVLARNWDSYLSNMCNLYNVCIIFRMH